MFTIRWFFVLLLLGLLTACGSQVAVNDSQVEAGPPPSPVPMSESLPMSRAKMSMPSVAVNTGAPIPEIDREQYAQIKANEVKLASEEPVSTFSIDVDTGAYANVRRMLNEGRLPRKDAVRVEELINYFSYADPAPDDETPFLVTTEVAPTPWNANTQLFRIALKAPEIDIASMPASNLVFLLDVSGSMNNPDKLPLLKRSLKLLLPKLREQDKVSIVVYAGASGVVLEPTPGSERSKIEQALDQLSAGGSTHGSAGIKLAYAKAQEAFIEDGVNRVILATDGDFNVGTVNHRALIDLIEEKRESGVFLTTLGFGTGNYNDKLAEQLANKGNGNHAYIDSLMEARKVLVEEMGGTLQTVAKDVKIQVEFNPQNVREYRLIGYENRLLNREDFNNDKVDAGEIGAGHSVVALYEIALQGSEGGLIEALRYAKAPASKVDLSDELAFVKLRYKAPDADNSQLLEFPVNQEQVKPTLAQASDDLRFSAAVAVFGQKLRGGVFTQDFAYNDIQTLARDSRGEDANGHRSAFLQLVGLADSLDQSK